METIARGASAGAGGGLTPECPGGQGSGALPEMATEAVPSRGTQARPPKRPHAHVETPGLPRAVPGSQTQRPPASAPKRGQAVPAAGGVTEESEIWGGLPACGNAVPLMPTEMR